jgi:molecular chaperone Hsp33
MGGHMGNVRKFIAEGTSVRSTFVECTEVVDQLAVNIRANPLATVVLGRTVAGALLLAGQSKREHKISIHFQGSGNLGDVYADAWFEGGCRGYVSNPQAEPTVENGRLNIGAGIGKGFLNVTTYAKGQIKPHVSSIEIQTGEVGDDIAYYLHQSQQVLSVVNIGARINDMGRVEAAGGLIIEMMQDVPDSIIDDLRQRMTTVRQITDRIFEGTDPFDIVSDYLDFLPLREIDHNLPVKIQCTCSEERILNTLMLLGKDEVQALVEMKKDSEIRCQFCGSHYIVKQPDLQALLAKLTR